MDNIVRTLEEIELTEAELEAIYGAVDAPPPVPVGSLGTCFNGTIPIHINGHITFDSIACGTC